MPHPLETALKTYDQNRARLIGKQEGKYVLIHEDQVVAVCDSRTDAIAQGYRQFGNVPFLVKQILKVESPEEVISFALGI